MRAQNQHTRNIEVQDVEEARRQAALGMQAIFMNQKQQDEGLQPSMQSTPPSSHQQQDVPFEKRKLNNTKEEDSMSTNFSSDYMTL